MELLRTSAIIFGMHAAQVLRSRRTLVALTLAVLPPLIAGLAVRFGPERATAERIFTAVATFLSLQVVVPILALVAGSAVVSDEIESRTITYPFTRPIPRPALLFGRWLASLVVVAGLLGASAVGVVLAAGSGRTSLPVGYAGPFVGACLAGGAVYSLLFASAGVFLRRPMIVGLGYAFAFEGFIANVPGETATLSIQFHLRSLFIDPVRPIWRTYDTLQLTKLHTPQEALTTLAFVLVVAAVVGGLGIARRQYVLTS